MTELFSGKEQAELKDSKTKRKIAIAFLKLRDKCLPERIKVKDICEVANINKTTFYNHYTDALELSNEIDDESIDRIIDIFPEKLCLFESPKTYIEGLASAIDREFDNIKIIFNDRVDVLCTKLEAKLKFFYENTKQTPEKQITASFAIGGAVGILKDRFFDSDEKHFEKKRFSECTSKFITAVTMLC